MTSSWYSSSSALSSRRRDVSDGMPISIPSYPAPLTFSNRPQQRILLIVIEGIAEAERIQVLIRQDVLLAVERGALRHVGTGHGPSRSRRHIRPGAVDAQAVVERCAARFH